MKAKWTAALAALALTATPAAADVGRTIAPVAQANALAGGGEEDETIGWIILAAILAWSTYLVIDEENDGSLGPDSP
jgi:hypothetical protein